MRIIFSFLISLLPLMVAGQDYTPEKSRKILELRDKVEASLTVLNNSGDLIPLKRLDTLRIATISIGSSQKTEFQSVLELYTGMDDFQLPLTASETEIKILKEKLENYNLLIIGLHTRNDSGTGNFRISKSLGEFISELAVKESVVFSVFDDPGILQELNNIEESRVLIEAFENSPQAQDLAAQLVFGGIGASGKLPVNIGDKFEKGAGVDVKGGIRFKFTLPEEAGMNSQILIPTIDSLVGEAIAIKAIPGAQVLVARNQKIVFYKAYGYKTYLDTVKVEKTDLYDLASITKISSALPVLMQLFDEGKFDLQAGIGEYLSYFKNSNKDNVPFRQILAHQARFKPWIPYWKSTLRKNGSFKWNTFKKDSSARFPVKIHEALWLHRNYRKKIFRAIKRSPLEAEAKYKYSGLVFYLSPSIVENIAEEGEFVEILNHRIYSKLGANTLTYNPLDKFPINRIVPTEFDFFFRHEPIHGRVHDEGAIMMGGVSGNAGLFSNANDLAKLMQMYLNMGSYGGHQFINESTLKEFSKTQFPENENHRALGFDKPYLEYKGENSNTAKAASDNSFGHTGFTGTMAWVDPEEGLVYIFLSNRVLPTRDNKRLYELNTRTKIQQVIYDSIED